MDAPKNRHITTNPLFLAALLSLALHIIFLTTVRATYWYDSIIYIHLAEHMNDLTSWQEYHTNNNRFMFQHLAYGLPFCLFLLKKIFGTYNWIAWAIFQFSISWLSLVFLTVQLSKKWLTPKTSSLVLISASLSSFYLSFHAAFLTESIASSLFNIALGITCIISSQNTDKKKWFWITALCLTLFSMTQFRYFNALLTTSFCIILAFNKQWLWRNTAIVCVTFLISYTTVPLIRGLTTEKFFMPNYAATNPHLALHLNEKLPQTIKEKIKQLPKPQAISDNPEDWYTYGFENFAITWTKYLSEKGLSDSEIRKQFIDLSLLLKSSSTETIFNGLMNSTASVGFTKWHLLFSKDMFLSHNQTLLQFSNHNKNHSLWLMKHSAHYKATLEDFVQRYKSDLHQNYSLNAIKEFHSSIKDYVTDTRSLPMIWLIDYVPFDFFILLIIGYSTWLLLSKPLRYQNLNLLVLLCIFLQVFISWSASVGDIRYFHGCLVVALISIAHLIDELTVCLKKLYRSNS